MDIKVEKKDQDTLEKMGVKQWPVWECEPSEFEWHYDQKETCLIIEGDVTVSTADGEVSFGAGDYVTFPQGLDCHWKVNKHVRKHYNFE